MQGGTSVARPQYHTTHSSRYTHNIHFLSGTAQAPNWPDARLGPFALKDPNFPLPGNVGVGQLLQPAAVDSSLQRQTVAEALLEIESEDIRKAVVMDCYVKDISEENYMYVEDVSLRQV